GCRARARAAQTRLELHDRVLGLLQVRAQPPDFALEVLAALGLCAHEHFGIDLCDVRGLLRRRRLLMEPGLERGALAAQRKREAGERDGARRRSHAPASTGRGLRLSRPTFWSSLAFGSLRETCILVFARLRLAARNLHSGLRSPSARCAKFATLRGVSRSAVGSGLPQ